MGHLGSYQRNGRLCRTRPVWSVAQARIRKASQENSLSFTLPAINAPASLIVKESFFT